MRIKITYFEGDYYALMSYENKYGQRKVTFRKVQGEKGKEFIRLDGADIPVDTEAEVVERTSNYKIYARGEWRGEDEA